MRGTPVYVVRNLKNREKEWIEKERKKLRILWQQEIDGWFTYRHYGILLTDGSVVHFTGSVFVVEEHAHIQRTSQEFFLDGGKMCVAKDVECKFSPKIIGARALSQVGGDFGGYHLLSNNCEHFVNWCANGKKQSKQVFFRIGE